MVEYDLNYLKENINLEVVHEAIDNVMDTDNDVSFKIGDIPMMMFESVAGKGYAIYVDIWDMETPCVSITKEDSFDEVCDKIYNGNNIDLATSIERHGDLTYDFFHSLNNKYGHNVKIPLFGGYIEFNNKGVLVHFDDLVIQSTSEYLESENRETTLYNRFLKSINVWDVITTAVKINKGELDNKNA